MWMVSCKSHLSLQRGLPGINGEKLFSVVLHCMEPGKTLPLCSLKQRPSLIIYFVSSIKALNPEFYTQQILRKRSLTFWSMKSCSWFLLHEPDSDYRTIVSTWQTTHWRSNEHRQSPACFWKMVPGRTALSIPQCIWT